jgi:hypothetical protein
MTSSNGAKLDADRIYGMLPAIYRVRDAEQGYPLRGLIEVIAREAGVVEASVAQMYEDLFIETCADWVVPYIGDLIGLRPLPGAGSVTRSEVANTIAYRRRKGTLAVLEQLAHDIGGCPAVVVEYFRRLAVTQYMNHLRPECRAMADLRDEKSLARIGTPFDTMPRTAEVRKISSRRGRYNIPNIGLFLWPVGAHRVTRGTPKRVKEECYTFDPLGMDTPLFNQPRPEREIAHLAGPINVPEPLNYAALQEELDLVKAGHPPAIGYFTSDPVFSVFRNGDPLSIRECRVCELADPDWTWPAAADTDVTFVVDPVRGRLRFATGAVGPQDRIRVSYFYGLGADIGSGEYARPGLGQPTRTVEENDGLQSAVNHAGAEDGIIEIAHSRTITGNLVISPQRDQRLVIQARDGCRPALTGKVTVIAADDAQVTLDGLTIRRGVSVSGVAPMALTIRRCTLPPASADVEWQGDGTLVVDKTISGPVRTARAVQLEVTDSIVDAQSDARYALSSPGPVRVTRTTAVGRVRAGEMSLAEDSLFTGHVACEHRQQGCMRFCSLPASSLVPRAYRCYHWHKDAPATPEPAFCSLDYGRPVYGLLSTWCTPQVRLGASDGAEMGAIRGWPLREANLQTRLDEYLRAGLEVGILRVTP